MTPADTTDFMILGFCVIFIPMIAYVVTLAIRTKKYKAEIEYLETNE